MNGNGNTERLVAFLVDLVKDPLVLIRYSAESWTTDCLVATLQDPKNPQRFFILGISNELPGWDVKSTGPKDLEGWDTLTDELEEWILKMNSLAKTTLIPEYVEIPQGRPVFHGDDNTKWVCWIPENGSYSFVRMLTSNPRIIAAPAGVKEMEAGWRHQYHYTKELTRLVQELTAVKGKIADLELKKAEIEQKILDLK